MRIFSHSVNQWTIYDAYIEDLQQKEKQSKEKSKVNVKIVNIRLLHLAPKVIKKMKNKIFCRLKLIQKIYIIRIQN